MDPHISETRFRKRFLALTLGGSGLPKKREDQHILLISSILRLDPEHRYSEAELNEALRLWSSQHGEPFGLDHVTLRRFLVDEGYLERDKEGSSYRLAAGGLPYTFDEGIRKIDLQVLIAQELKEREERKRRHMQAGGE